VIGRAAFALFALFLLAGRHDPEIRYFTDVREIKISEPDRQNYAVVDSEIWEHTRPDLADIRLYDDTTQVPYILLEQKPRTATVEQEAKLLNLGMVGDHAEFDLDLAGIAQYDRVRLQLDAKDFVVTALVFGQNSLNQKSRTQLPPSTLYDFSREKLGSNFVVQLPTSSFRYLHVQLTPGIRPAQVKSATVFDVQEKHASWTTAGNCDQPAQQGKTTTINCSLPAGVPLERMQFEIPPDTVNFRRNVSVSAGDLQVANGDISRVRLKRGGTEVVSKQMFVDVPGVTDKREVTVTITNGDDPPLRLVSVQPLALERRIYFDPSGRSSLKLYYGDPNLEAPVYDYAKFFQEDPAALLAQLGVGLHNAEYTGRPDERPWSERHKVILWAAMLGAVAVLAVLAFRGLASKTPA
jgi:Protein of unknown function (DUF3999)